jgi:C-terminal processing protease CtpA/Prc
VELGVERNNGIITLTVTIGEFFSPSVTVNQFDDNITYIGLHVFLSATGTTGGTAAEFRTALQQTAGAQYTILDLRNNGGGETSHAIRIVSEFVASNTPIMDTEERVYDEAANQGRTITSQVVTQDGGLVIDRNFVVLVNGFTASAAELMVAALRTHRGDIKIVGETTFGKARGQVLSITPESGIAKVTSLLLTPIGGTSYDLVGIAPDVVVPAGQDALDIAVDTIYSTLSKTADATLSSRLRNLKSALHLAKSMKYTTPLNYQWSQ